MNNISKFGSEISEFRNNSIDYTYSFNSAGNLFFMDTGSFNQSFLVISGSRFTYNDTGIKSFLDLEFREFVASSSISASTSVDFEAIANQLNTQVLSLQDLLLTAQSDASLIPVLTSQINEANSTISSLRSQLNQAQTTDSQLSAQLAQTVQSATDTQQKLSDQLKLQQADAASALASQSASVMANVIVNATPSVWVNSVAGSGNFSGGSTQTISVTPRAGFVFYSWSDGNQTNPRTIVVPLTGETYTANVKPATTTISSGQSNTTLSNLGLQFENLYLNGAYGTVGTVYVNGSTNSITVATNPLSAYDLDNNGSLDATEITAMVSKYNSGDVFLMNWFGISPNTSTGVYEPKLHPLTAANLQSFITSFNNYQITITTEENLIEKFDKNNNGLTPSDFTESNLQQTASDIFVNSIGSSPTVLDLPTLQNIIAAAYSTTPTITQPTGFQSASPVVIVTNPTITPTTIPLTGPTNVKLQIPTAPSVYGPPLAPPTQTKP